MLFAQPHSIVTILGLQFARLTGAVITERYSVACIGRLRFSRSFRDYPPVQLRLIML